MIYDRAGKLWTDRIVCRRTVSFEWVSAWEILRRRVVVHWMSDECVRGSAGWFPCWIVHPHGEGGLFWYRGCELVQGWTSQTLSSGALAADVVGNGYPGEA